MYLGTHTFSMQVNETLKTHQGTHSQSYTASFGTKADAGHLKSQLTSELSLSKSASEMYAAWR